MDIKREFAALSERLQEEESKLINETVKRLVGRPRKQKQTVLLKSKIEGMKSFIKLK